jgi:hypothetical protein
MSEPSKNYTIRLYQKGDEEQIVQLFNEVYGKPLTIEQWRWKYFGQGNLRVWAAVALDENGAIVAHYGGLPVRMIFKGRHITACQCVDAMVKESHRAKSLGIPQTEGAFYRVCNLLYDTFGTFFYTIPGDVCYNWGKKTGHIEECITVIEYRYNVQNPVTTRGFYSLRPILWGDERIDNLWHNVSHGLGWVMVRDREFLHWRFETNPFYQHYLYGLEHLFSRKLLGWGVYRENSDELLLMDLVFEERALDVLLMKFVRLAHSLGKKQVRLWLPQRYHPILETAGFEPYDIRTWIPNLTRYKAAEASEVKEKLYYTMADTDFL